MFLERKDWHWCEGAQEAIQKELDRVLSSPMEHGLVRGDFSNLNSFVGKLMTILLVKHLEGRSLRKPKRELFDGNIRGNEGNLAVLF